MPAAPIWPCSPGWMDKPSRFLMAVGKGNWIFRELASGFAPCLAQISVRLGWVVCFGKVQRRQPEIGYGFKGRPLYQQGLAVTTATE